MLLCGIINELEQAIVAEGHCRNLAYFFCQASNSRINNAIAVLRGLIYLLAHQQPRLISHVRKYTDAGKSFTDANAWFALSDILANMLDCRPRMATSEESSLEIADLQQSGPDTISTFQERDRLDDWQERYLCTAAPQHGSRFESKGYSCP
jgi:hypothetical protein